MAGDGKRAVSARSADQRAVKGPARIGLALAGGAPGGAVYEIGALRALDEALDGLDFNGLDVYVGVSAGAIISACLCNGLTPAQMCRAVVSRDPGDHPFVPETFLTPAFREFRARGGSLPKLVSEAIWHYARHPGDARFSAALMRVGRALPVGLFDNEPIAAYFEKIFGIKGRTNDFRRLERNLNIVATDLDSGEAVRFGAPGWDHVPISVAVQASSALPGLYPPVKIDGRYYVDGVLLRTLHTSVALDAGASLVLCINPIVPVDTGRAREEGYLESDWLVDRGLPAVLSQSLRTLIHSRLAVGMKAYEKRYDADIVLLEPKRDDYRMFFTNIFGFSDRRAVCEHGYQSTRRELLARFDELAPLLAKHGVSLRREVLLEKRRLWSGVGLPELDGVSANGVVTRLGGALDRLESLLAAETETAMPKRPTRSAGTASGGVSYRKSSSAGRRKSPRSPAVDRP